MWDIIIETYCLKVDTSTERDGVKMFKKKICFLLSMLMLIGTVTTVCMAGTGSKRVRGSSNYNEEVESSTTLLRSIGTSGIAYSTLYNKTSTTYYMEAKVREYTYDTGYTKIEYNAEHVIGGSTVDSGMISRDANKYTVDYEHNGYRYVSQGTSATYETHSFIAMQYYRD